MNTNRDEMIIAVTTIAKMLRGNANWDFNDISMMSLNELQRVMHELFEVIHHHLCDISESEYYEKHGNFQYATSVPNYFCNN